jgi:uncharacterized protein (TIGR03435 family)
MTSTRFSLIIAGAGLLLMPLASSVMRAQSTPAVTDKPKFEVAAVRENTRNERKVMILIQPGGRFTVVGAGLPELMHLAFAVQRTQLVGAPEWTETAKYDITAKAESDIQGTPPGGPPGPLNFMLQELLEDRFKLRVHRETRELPTYALTLARTDRRLGEGLRASTVDCAAMRGRGGRGGPPPGPPPPGERPQCGMRVAPNQIVAGGVSLAQLTQILSQFSQRIVIDRTGLEGTFDIDLSFTLDGVPNAPPPPPGGPPPPSVDPNNPSLFTALQEQLGLKLESARAPVEVLVIDHVERPTPD